MTAYADFMARAYAMELEAAERYAQFAEQLETHNNPEVARVFRKLADIESLHAKNILARMKWPGFASMPVPYAADDEGPETAPFDSVHYRMQPWHALEIALRGELRAQQFFSEVAATSRNEGVRAMAAEMAEEEREHAELIREWMKKVPQPAAGWDEDPDPPRMTE
jgi:rubrerythrin